MLKYNHESSQTMLSVNLEVTDPCTWDLIQWGQPVGNPASECCLLSTSNFVYASSDPNSVWTADDARTYHTSPGNSVTVRTNRLDECLPILFVFQYCNYYHAFFDASRFLRDICFSDNFFDIYITAEVPLTCVSGCVLTKTTKLGCLTQRISPIIFLLLYCGFDSFNVYCCGHLSTIMAICGKIQTGNRLVCRSGSSVIEHRLLNWSLSENISIICTVRLQSRS